MKAFGNKFSIILSRTDSIGDVVLTLPMAGRIKKEYPACTIYFLGRTYTKDVVALSKHVDGFINYDELEKLERPEQVKLLQAYKADMFVHVFPKGPIADLAKAAEIPLRVGTTNRLFHWFTCNKLIRLSRKKSPLHEAQLNMKLLEFLKIPTKVSLPEIVSYYGFTRVPVLEEKNAAMIANDKFNLILHPKSKGSAKEWGLENFARLVAALPADRYNIFISGTAEDGKHLRAFVENNPVVTDLTGKLSLAQFIAFIDRCDGLIAASTGPLHIAAALNKKAIGLFSPKRPIHPGRWKPLGQNAQVLVYDENCSRCAKKQDCDCITRIKPQEIINLLENP